MKHLNNPYMLLAWGIGLFLQVLVTEIPYFVELFGTSRLSLGEWKMLFALSCMPLLVHELLILSEKIRKIGESRSEETLEGKEKEKKSRKEGQVA